MDVIWQALGGLALVAIGWLQVKSWRRGVEIDALKRKEAERKAADAAMVATAAERLKRAKDGKAPPVDPNNRDAFR